MLKKAVIGITGSEGFVGKSLVKRVEEENALVLKMDSKRGLDMCDWEVVDAIGRIDIVIHLAAKTSVPESFLTPREVLHGNIVSTLNVLELCRKYMAKIIFASSSVVYGIPQLLPINENHPNNGSNPYAISKIVGENLCRAYNQSFGIKALIVRAFNIYGPNQSSNSVVADILHQIKQNEIILKDPHPKRDFIYIDDVIEAYVKLCAYENSAFEIFNIGTGESYSVKELVDTAIQIIGKKIEVKYAGEKRINEINEIRADIAKANKLLDWKPIVGLEEGMKKIIDRK